MSAVALVVEDLTSGHGHVKGQESPMFNVGSFFYPFLISIQEESWQLCIGMMSIKFREGANINNISVLIDHISTSVVTF